MVIINGDDMEHINQLLAGEKLVHYLRLIRQHIFI